MVAKATYNENSISLNLDKDRRLFYSIKRNGKVVVKESRLGLVLDDMPALNKDFFLEQVKNNKIEGSWEPLYGERSVIDESCEETIVILKDGFGRLLEIHLRAYAEGVALRYFIPKQKELKEFTITDEETYFNFPEGSIAWEEHGAEGEYFTKPINEVGGYCERPMVVSLREGGYVLVHEAGLMDYSRMLLIKNESEENSLKVHLSGHMFGLYESEGYTGYGLTLNPDEEDSLNCPVAAKAPFETPWRVFILADEAKDLLCKSNMILNLSEPCKIEDTFYIKPGKAFRETTLTTEGAYKSIDFCVDHNFQYILFDWKWYGPHDKKESDPRRVAEDVDLELEKVIAYGREKGIGIFLYIDRTAAEIYLEDALPVWKKWGIAGIKLGFVKTGPQKWTKWLVDAVRKCHEYGLMVNIHDAYRPTGLSRTYPNVLTQEGIRGNEHFPTAAHNTTLPFTRFPAGAGDYTLCYFDKRLKVTHAHMLAMGVIVYSPMQMMFWYDQPSFWNGEKEIAFWEKLPVVWDESIGLCGEIGEYAVIARRSKEEWFVGCINNEKERKVKVFFDFLENGKSYVAEVFEDSPQLATSTKVRIRSVLVTKATILELDLVSTGGIAIYITLQDK